ncbi:TerD family protein [bacterium]|nr:TerD family protein [bacterium]
MAIVERGFRSKLQGNIDLNRSFAIHLDIEGSSVYDFSCFGVDANNNLSDERYMIFYNQLNSPKNELSMRLINNGCEINANLLQLPASVNKLVLTASIDGNGVMGDIRKQNLLISQNGVTIFEAHFPGKIFQLEKSLIVAEIYKHNGEWRINFVAQGFVGGLSDLLKHYGGEEDTSVSAPEPAPAPAPVPMPVSAPAPAPNPTPAPAPSPAPVSAPKPKVGDTIKFGKFAVEEGGKPEPIEWQILDIQNNRALLLSLYSLTSMPIVRSSTYKDAAASEVSGWLNAEFIGKSFTSEEAKRIVVSRLTNKRVGLSFVKEDELPDLNTKVFLLSLAEVLRYLPDDDGKMEGKSSQKRVCKATEFARYKGAIPCGGYVNWWLRSSCERNGSAICVSCRGNICSRTLASSGCGVRPAMWIELD